MSVTDTVQGELVHSVIEFTDRDQDYFGGTIGNRERLEARLPELQHGERIVLNGWGSWEDEFDCPERRRRLGIYTVVHIRETEQMKCSYGYRVVQYVLREEQEFTEGQLAHALLTGDFQNTVEQIKGLRYLALDDDKLIFSR